MKPTSTENPFAVPARKPAVFRSVKSLLVVAVCLATVLVVQFGSKHWLYYKLTSDWDSQSATVRLERLSSLAELDDLGRPMLVRALADPDRRVAQSAFDRLLDQQAEWVAMTDDRADEKYLQLVEQLAELASELPADRRGWFTTLLNATITETVEHPSEAASLAYSRATELLSDRPVDSRPAEAVETSSVRIALRTKSLPVDLTDQREDDDEDESPGSENGASDERASDPERGELRLAPPNDPKRLRPLSEASEKADDADGARSDSDAERVVVPAQHLTDAPFETYSTRSVISWLRSVQPKLRDMARVELIRRGFGESELEIAARMADPDVRVRLGLLSDLNDRVDLDPRPWLLWMAEDAERDVRLRALTCLATMQDPNIREKLRERLPHESDPAVVSLLRRVLSQR